MTQLNNEKIAIIGIGRLGKSLARALCEVGCDVIALSDRNRDKALDCAKKCGDSTNYYTLEWLPQKATMIILTVPDDHIQSMARKIAELNVVDCNTLKEAKKKPEEYKNLIVRVAGFSAYFTKLDPVIQDEIILRTELSFG